MAHERLLTNVERCHRGMSNEHICPCCNFAPETLMHRLAFFLVNARFSLEKKNISVNQNLSNLFSLD
jgi:hypothetical protein